MQRQRLMRSAQKETAKTPSSTFLQTVPDMQTDSTTQASVEPRLGHDFRQIPLHSTQTAVLQTKLALSQPGDVYEQEADHVADQVMGNSKPEPALLDERDEASPSLVRKPSSEAGGAAAATEVSSQVHPGLSSGGQPLDAETQAFMEPRFGHDFSKVRIHADERAAESAQSVNALAYTVGQDIVFGEGQYAPGTSAGKRLLAHELTHTLQQRPAGEINQEAGTEPMQVTPGPLVQRQVDTAAPDSTDQSTSETSDQSESETSKPVAEMTSTEKLVAAIKIGAKRIPSEVWERVKAVFSPQQLAIAVFAALATFMVLQATPVGWAATLGLAITAFFVGSTLIEAASHLIKFAEARNATSDKELSQAGQEFADAVSVAGVNTVLFLLTRKIGNKMGKDMGGPGGPPTGLAPALATPGGEIVVEAVETIPGEAIPAAEASGKAAAATISTVMMASSGSGSGGEPSGLGKGTSEPRTPRNSKDETLSKGKPVIVLGESMSRVNPVAEWLRKLGYNVQTFNPTKAEMANEDTLMAANMRWLKKWVIDEGAQVVDVERDLESIRKGGKVGRRGEDMSIFYDQEDEHITKWKIDRFLLIWNN